MNKNLSNLTSNDGEKGTKTMKHTFDAELLKMNTSNEIATEPTEITDPNNVIQTAFEELKKLPPEILEKLGGTTFEIKYQLIPSVTVTFK